MAAAGFRDPITLNQPWFQGAPVSKTVAIGLILVHVLLHSRKSSSSDPMMVDQYRDGSDSAIRWYRLVSSKFTFGSNGELVMGMSALIMLMRRFEREMGSRKFLFLLFVTNIFTVVLEGIIILAFDISADDTSKINKYSGPYPWLGTVLLLYARYTPRLHPRFISILGIPFSEKALYYSSCAYLIMYHHDLTTLYPTILGVLVAHIFVHPHNPVTDFPNFMVRMFPWERVFSFLADPPARVYAPMLTPLNVRRATGDTLLNQVRGGNGPIARPVPRQPPAAAQPPPESAIEQLTAMGFDRQRVLEALQSSNNSVERAADRLLSGAG